MLTKEPLYHQLYRVIRAEIIRGELSSDSGGALNDQVLSDRYGTSRTPVREAVRQLVSEGLLVSSPNKGYEVYKPTPSEVAEIYTIRASLEALAASLAAFNPDLPATVEKMEKVLARTEKAASRGASRKVAQLNDEFHDLFIRASASSHLVSLLEVVRGKALLCRISSMRIEEHITISITEHQKFIDALVERDSEGVGELVRQHVLTAGKRLIERLNEDGRLEPTPIHRFYQHQFPASEGEAT